MPWPRTVSAKSAAAATGAELLYGRARRSVAHELPKTFAVTTSAAVIRKALALTSAVSRYEDSDAMISIDIGEEMPPVKVSLS